MENREEDATVEGQARPKRAESSAPTPAETVSDSVSQVTELGWMFARNNDRSGSSTGLFSPEEQDAAKKSPTNFPLVSVVGAGGIGEIWKARQTSLERVIAVKRMQPRFREQFANDPARLLELQHSFRQEALITASLEHPNIVPIYDLGQDSAGNPLLAMKLIKGERWDHCIARDFETMRPVELLDRHLPTFISMMQAVAFAHSKGIVHRDIKPSQVMVGEFGEVVLMDWGLAVYVGPERGASDSSVDGLPAPWVLPTPETAQGRAGTPSLMSPEQTLNTARKITRKTDTFLLGATLYYLLTGTYLYEGGTTESAIARASNCEIEPLTSRNPGRYVPPELARICMHALMKSPEDRIESVTRFIVMVQDYLSGASERRASEDMLHQLRLRLDGADPTAPGGLMLKDLPPDASPAEVYAEFASCMSILDQARGLWPKNPSLDPLNLEVVTRYAHAALERGDMVLAMTLIGRLPQGQERNNLQLEASQREVNRKRFGQTRRLAIRLSVFFGVALLITVTLLALQQALAYRQLNQITQSLNQEKRAAVSANLNMRRAQADQELDNYFNRIAFSNLAVDSNQMSKVYSSLFADFPALLRNWEWGRLVARVNSDRMTLLSTTLPDQILHAEYSPDGARIITGEMDGRVRLWDARSGRQLLERKVHTGGVWAARFSRDGSRVLTSSFDRSAVVLDSVGLSVVTTLPTHNDILRSGSLSIDGRLALTVSRDTQARLVRVTDGEILWSVSDDTTRLYDSDFHPGGQMLILAGNRSAKLLRLTDGSVIGTLPAHPGNILSVRFSPNGQFVATASADRVLRVFNTETRNLVYQVTNEQAYLHSVAWSPDGTMLATGDDEGRLVLWDAASGRKLGSTASRSSMYKVNFSPDGRMVVCATAVTCQVHEVDRILRNQERRALSGKDVGEAQRLTPDPVARLRVYSSPYERIGAWPGYDSLWRVPAGRTEVRKFGTRVFIDSHYTAINPAATESLELDPVNLSVIRRDLLNPEKPGLALPIPNTYWLDYSPNGQLAVFLSSTEGAVAYDTGKWEKKWQLPADTFGAVTTSTRFGGRAVFDPSGEIVALATHSGTVIIADATQGKILRRLHSPSKSAFNCAISNNGQLIATGGLSDTVNVWDLQTGDLLTTMSGLEKFVVGLAFSPDDQRLLTSSNDDRLRLWDTATGREIMQVDYLDGQEILVGAGFTPTGRSIIAADSYGRIHIYESFPSNLNSYPGTETDPPQLRVEWLKRLERIGADITRQDVEKVIKANR